MSVASFDILINPSFNILERQGKLQCPFFCTVVLLSLSGLISYVMLCRGSLLTFAGLRMVSRICQRGARWSAPRCGSWVAAPLSVTILVGIEVVKLLLSERCTELWAVSHLHMFFPRKRHLQILGDESVQSVREGNEFADS